MKDSEHASAKNELGSAKLLAYGAKNFEIPRGRRFFTGCRVTAPSCREAMQHKVVPGKAVKCANSTSCAAPSFSRNDCFRVLRYVQGCNARSTAKPCLLLLVIKTKLASSPARFVLANTESTLITASRVGTVTRNICQALPLFALGAKADPGSSPRRGNTRYRSVGDPFYHSPPTAERVKRSFLPVLTTLRIGETHSDA